MQIKSQKIKKGQIAKHETKRHVLRKFLFVLVIFLGYFLFIASKYGLRDGFLVSALTWSFFVLCTPIADAGFLIDFPMRLVLKIRMLFIEIFVWLIAISLNLYAIFLNPQIYDKTEILILFTQILLQPIPFWLIILVSATGTFLSIQFGDELLDEVKHKHRKYYQKHRPKYIYIIMVFLVLGAIVLYDFLLKQLGVNLPI